MDTYEYPAEVIEAATEHRRQFNNALWKLLEKWYQIAADEMVGDNTRHIYRECANELDDILGTWTGKPADPYRSEPPNTASASSLGWGDWNRLTQ
jgi:hypothetical protein